MQLKALVINDTRPGAHLGCVLVMAQLTQGLQAAGLHVQACLSLAQLETQTFHEALGLVHVVVINGEGTMHHDAPGALRIMRAGMAAQRRGLPVALINTVWQANEAITPLLACCQLIAARESFSAQAIGVAGYQAQVVPDLTLCNSPASLFGAVAKRPAMSAPIVVMDDVRPTTSLLLARYARVHGLPYLPMAGRPSLRRLAGWARWWQLGQASGWARQCGRAQAPAIQQASSVLTGRFHGMCLAVMARRPFIALASNTHKVEGLLHDANLGPGAIFLPDPPEDHQQAIACIDAAVESLRMAMSQPGAMAAHEAACERYLALARSRSQALFAGIAALAASKVSHA